MKAVSALAVSWLVIAGILAMFIAIPQNVAAQSITVTNPTGSSVWCQGDYYAIQWDSYGSVSSSVSIDYGYSYYSPTTIASYTSNDGYYLWTVPYSAYPRDDYYIRVTDYYDPSISDDSPYFQIDTYSGCSTTGTITVTAPTISDVWYTGSTYDITWTTTGSVGSYVRIQYECLLCSSPTGTITSSTQTSSGRYSWTLPTSMTVDQMYTIIVTDTSNYYIYDDSSYFTVRAGTNMLLVAVVIAIIATVLVVVLLVVFLTMRKKKTMAPPAQANLPVMPPATQYAPAQYPPQYAPGQQAPVGATKMCVNCGRSIPAEFTFCIHCGGRT